MGFWNRLKTAFSGAARKSGLLRTLLRRVGINPQFRLSQYQDYVQEGYQENPYVYTAIRETALSVSEIPPKLFRITGEGGEVARALEGYDRKGHTGHRDYQKKRRAVGRVMTERAKRIKRETGLPAVVCRQWARKALVQTGDLEPVPSHELLDLLDEPNPYTQESYQKYVQSLVTELEIGGEVLQEPIRPGDNQPPRELYVHGPRQLRIDGDRQVPIREIRLNNVRLRYDPEPQDTEIFYHKYYNPDQPLRGQSPAMAAARSIETNNEGRGWNLSLLQNGAELSGFLSFAESVQPSDRERWKEQIDEMEPGEILTFDGSPVSFEPASMSPKDMQWMDLSKLSAREVATVWGVPPEILGDSSSKTYSNYSESRRAFYMEKVIPLTSFLFGELNRSITPLFGDDLFLDYDLSVVDALQEDVNEQHERIREDVKAGILTINEARKAIGRETVTGGDRILIPSTQIPLEASTDEDEQEEERAALMKEYGGDPLFPRVTPNGH